MKKVVTLTAAILISAIIYSQSPGKFSYQAVVRNSVGELVKSKDVGFKISVLQGSAGGTAVYVETHTVATNVNGLATLEIGSGSVVSGDFSTIDWSAGPYFMKTEADPEGGASYTITGTSELLSVPYALHSKNAEGMTGTITASQISDFQTGVTNNPAVLANTAKNSYPAADAAKLAAITGTNTGDQDLSGLATTASLTAGLDAKVDKVTGKGLSTEDYTSAEKTKVSNLTGVNTGDQDLTGLATTTSLTSGLNAKVDKVAGKGLSTEDYTSAEKTKLTGIATGAEVNVNADWNTVSGDAEILNKPIIPTTTSQLTNDAGFITSETDPTVKAINGIVRSDGTAISAAIAGDFPILNQNTTGNAATATTAATVTTAAQPVITSVGTLISLVVSGTTTVATPVNATDAATKEYVDELKSQLEELQVAAGIKIKDIEGNIYKTVTIGTQVWMAENLKTNKYNDGSAIPLVTAGAAWAALTTPAYCWYNNDAVTYKATYGALYNWYALDATSNGGKNVCPIGWHVSTDAEWLTLTTYLGGGNIGGKLKEIGTTHWITPNSSATNETGFTALPGGIRYNDGTFYYITNFGYWWTDTQSVTTNAWMRAMYYNNSNLDRGSMDIKMGFSVRCLKD